MPLDRKIQELKKRGKLSCKVAEKKLLRSTRNQGSLLPVKGYWLWWTLILSTNTTCL
jgi:hypothetical protein